jgi:uncharacterized protein YhfF/isopentenyldiphosphate isomerase
MRYDDLPRFELAFPGPLRDRLVAAVLSGAKTATTGLREEYERLPVAGDRSVLIDSGGRPVAVVETTGVRVLPLGDVDLAHVRDEGEGHGSVPEWRAAHERFWRSEDMRAVLGDPGFTVDDRTPVVAERFRVVTRIAPPSAEELLDIVDEHDRVVAVKPRGEAYARGLRHRCVFVYVRDGEGRVFVHRRTPAKLVFPSLYDMFVGGVVGAGESYDDAALREAEEELGVTGLPRPTPVLTFLYEDAAAGHRWWSRVYQVRCDLPVSPQAEEVAWHAFVSEEELERRLAEWEWVPDGREAYRRLRAHAGPGAAAQSG